MEKIIFEAQKYINQVYEDNFGGGADQLDVKVNSANPNYSWEVTHKEEGWLAYVPRIWVDEEKAEDIVKNFEYIIRVKM
jgi:hypothetical protein